MLVFEEKKASVGWWACLVAGAVEVIREVAAAAEQVAVEWAVCSGRSCTEMAAVRRVMMWRSAGEQQAAVVRGTTVVRQQVDNSVVGWVLAAEVQAATVG